MKNKIIFISSYTTLRKFNSFEYNPSNDFFYSFGMAPNIYGDILEKNNCFEIEIWRADINVNQYMDKRLGDSVLGRVFPAKILFKGFLQSKEFFNALKKERKHNVIFFILGMHALFLTKIAYFVRKHPLISIQIGGAHPLWRFNKTRKIKSLMQGAAELLFSARNHDYVCLANEEEKSYWGRMVSEDKLISRPLIHCDVDSFFYPINKTQAKMDLELPLDKKIILVVGRLFYNVGVQYIIDIIKKLESNDFYFLWVGIDDSEGNLLEKLKSTGIRYEGRKWVTDLCKYYNAADLYLYTPFDQETLDFGGTGYQSIESLACGTPVVSSTMHVFPGKINSRACKVPKKSSDLIPMVLDVFNDYPSVEECREMVYELYNKENIMNYQIQLYRELFLKYYNVEI